MGKYRYGLKTFEISDIDEAGAIVSDSTVDLTANVYKKSLEITEAEGTTTKHFAEGFSIPAVVLKEAGEETAKVALFGVDLSLLESLKGGVSATYNDKTKYVKPITEGSVEKHVRFVTKDGVEIIYKRAFIDTARDEKLNDSDVAMLNVIMIPLIPNDDSDEAVIIQEEGYIPDPS